MGTDRTWLFSMYSVRLLQKVGMTPMTPGLAGVAEDDGDIVVWFDDHTEKRFKGMAG